MALIEQIIVKATTICWECGEILTLQGKGQVCEGEIHYDGGVPKPDWVYDSQNEMPWLSWGQCDACHSQWGDFVEVTDEELLQFRVALDLKQIDKIKALQELWKKRPKRKAKKPREESRTDGTE